MIVSYTLGGMLVAGAVVAASALVLPVAVGWNVVEITVFDKRLAYGRGGWVFQDSKAPYKINRMGYWPWNP